jgi:hypothetical protein
VNSSASLTHQTHACYLSVEDDKQREEQQAAVQLHIEEHGTSKEHVDQSIERAELSGTAARVDSTHPPQNSRDTALPRKPPR